MPAANVNCRHRGEYRWLFFVRYRCERARGENFFRATRAVCATCDAPAIEATYNCLHLWVETRKPYSDRNWVDLEWYCKRAIAPIRIPDLANCNAHCPGYSIRNDPYPQPQQRRATSRLLRAVSAVLVIVIAILLARVSALTIELEKREKAVATPLPARDLRRTTDSLLVTASEHLLTKRYSEALTTYQSVLRREPGNQLASLGVRGTREVAVANYNYLAFQYSEAGNYGSAITLFNKALSFDPNDRVAKWGKEIATKADATLRR